MNTLSAARSQPNDFTLRDEQMCHGSYLTLDIIRREGWFRVSSIEGRGKYGGRRAGGG